MSNILIAGGAGFIGSHLCEFLLSEGYTIYCVDNLLTGVKSNISHLLDNDNFIFLEADVIEPLSFSEEFEAIIHLASPASPKSYLANPIVTLLTGSIGTYNLLELAKEKQSIFLLASTSEIYGDPLEHPQKEDYFGNVNPIGVRSVYDEAKRFAEAITTAYNRYHKVSIRIARVFNTYGPKMRADDGRAVPSFISQALKGDPITIHGKGVQTRSFSYVSDTVEGIYRLLFSQESHPMNIGNPIEIPLLDLAKRVRDLTGSSSRLVYTRLPEDDPKRRKPDISRAIGFLGWSPKVSIDEGLKKTIEWFKQCLDYKNP